MAEMNSIPTTAEKQYHEVFNHAEKVMLDKVMAAIQEAEETSRTAFLASGLSGVPPVLDYFVATTHQKLYYMLCHADLETFVGGDPKIAVALIRNAQNIAKRYWGADIEPYPQP
jgi:hypothetical protein